MANIRSWISALRPRTLFLAVATALCGSGIAYSSGKFSVAVCILTMLTATVLQLLSNMANDFGDFEHGTDITGERVGPQRSLQSGAISPKQMKIAIIIAIVIAAITGLCLIYIASQFMPIEQILLFLLLGVACIIAAIKYTAGKNPYGYRGLGDIFSFVFFGPVSVVGTYFLHTHEFVFQPWLPALGLGFFTVAVLNVNNMRDMENDRKSGKITIAIKLGLKKAKQYHAFLTIGGIACFVFYNVIYTDAWYNCLYFVVFLLFIKILFDIFKTKENRLLDPYLKYTSMSAFFLSILFCISINL
ncbi:1,4-dihydroxy-2-naphthoate octaprenyltransferase [Dysgonomonas sp. 216]|uniref:1,4-dihydroxy-2-naphthoate octaprenyltransferase n=1 Tax=Dysgonomonas sp. 216 TaxID=2302934 RepID=UPI0013D36C71|nr:1,4-dihydroxy-2-naphthoate octaprenyltransferase [Dysgonomonas sp. 216]NDW19305.1 1,4-dihydroxy-2-naphthoate octaprenyltransferase [Dysgonomonas sp. 216]